MKLEQGHFRRDAKAHGHDARADARADAKVAAILDHMPDGIALAVLRSCRGYDRR